MIADQTDLLKWSEVDFYSVRIMYTYLESGAHPTKNLKIKVIPTLSYSH